MKEEKTNFIEFFTLTIFHTIFSQAWAC